MMKLDNRKAGDITPSNDEIRNHLFNEGIKYEMEIDGKIFSNPYIEIKTENWELFKRTGNIFVEYKSLHPERDEFIPSGIQTTESPVWVYSFKDKNGLIPKVIYCFYTKHLLETINKGVEEGWVHKAMTSELSTKDYNYGYLVPIIKLLDGVYSSIKDELKPELDAQRAQHQLMNNPTEEMRNNRLRELHLNKTNKGKNE